MTASPADRYTHGHHDSVLASHRTRTAENSAAYLLPHLAAGRHDWVGHPDAWFSVLHGEILARP